MKKKKIGFIFGGTSTEHEISLLSTKSIVENLDSNLFDYELIGITKDGSWMLLNKNSYLLDENDTKKVALDLKDSRIINPDFSKRSFFTDDGKEVILDVVFPVLHGENGEDGTVQGLLELLGIKYVGCGVSGSSLCMDKDIAKRLLNEGDVLNAEFLTLRRGDTVEYEEVIKTLGQPIFVKAANGGSSIGVYKVNSLNEYKLAITEAFKLCEKVLIEKAINGREIEISVLGNDKIEASKVLGEIIPNKEEYYSFDAKYINEDGVLLKAPAQISEEIVNEVSNIAIKSFRLLECRGLARIDFFITEDSKIYLNEVNTLPGFTKISMYPKLWSLSGLDYSHLITKLIDLAQE